ncbi:UNVERIFIED_ORG: hypothetical protein J2W85_004106 [Ensifer adhaerens]|nr:hypothetical protein [Ensifer adhaerens]
MNFYGISLDGKEPSASTQADMLNLFDLLRPRPSSKPFIRIGDNKDGAYLVPDDLDGITACFSPGVNNVKDFEDAMVERFGIDCHMCDFSSDLENFATPLIEGRQTFQKKWLNPPPGDADSIALDDWVADKAPAGDLLLQIDIEGAEYRNLLLTSESVLSRFRVIVLEVHSLSYIMNSAILATVFMPFFKRLSDIFTVVHAHPNNCCGEFNIPGTNVKIPNVLELTYLRKDRIDEPAYPVLIPHPLDVTRNVINLPPLFLGEEWLEGPRPLESRVKMLEEIMDEQARVAAQAVPPVGQPHVDLIMRSLGTLGARLDVIAPSPNQPVTEVAVGRPYELSSAYGNTGTSGAVGPNGDFFFHTSLGQNQFIRIDLGQSRSIKTLKITNRLDQCFDRAKNLFAILSDIADGSGEVFHVPTSEDFVAGRNSVCEFTIPATNARFVTIITPDKTALHLSNVEIFAVA